MTHAKFTARFHGLLAMVNECKPTDLTGFADILSKADMHVLETLVLTGHVLRSIDGRYFAPSLCTRG